MGIKLVKLLMLWAEKLTFFRGSYRPKYKCPFYDFYSNFYSNFYSKGFGFECFTVFRL